MHKNYENKKLFKMHENLKQLWQKVDLNRNSNTKYENKKFKWNYITITYQKHEHEKKMNKPAMQNYILN
jgi:disulfide oxidoreductase YuzD